MQGVNVHPIKGDATMVFPGHKLAVDQNRVRERDCGALGPRAQTHATGQHRGYHRHEAQHQARVLHN